MHPALPADRLPSLWRPCWSSSHHYRGGGRKNIAIHARVEKFTSPMQCRRVLDFSAADVSPRTIDRRMQEAGLFGRVAP